MFQNFTFSQFVNALVIGVIFEVIIVMWLFSLLNIEKEFVETVLNHSSILVLASLIFSLPLWRIVSNYVEFVMEPVGKDEKTTKTLYRKFFFATTTVMVEGRVELFRDLVSSNASTLQKYTRSKIENSLGIELEKFSEDELYKLYDIIKALVYQKSNDLSIGHFSQHQTVANFHARLAILCNFGFLFSVSLVIISFWFVTKFEFFAYIVASSLFFILARHFGCRCSQSRGQDYWILISEFLALEVQREQNSKA